MHWCDSGFYEDPRSWGIYKRGFSRGHDQSCSCSSWDHQVDFWSFCLWFPASTQRFVIWFRSLIFPLPIAWEATWGKILTLDRLQKRGWQLPNCCFLCGCEEETVNHILLHYTVVRVLWEIILALFGVPWVFPKIVKEVLFSWKDPFVGKKRKNIWNSISLCIFWTVWKERNRLAFRGVYVEYPEIKEFFCL